MREKRVHPREPSRKALLVLAGILITGYRIKRKQFTNSQHPLQQPLAIAPSDSYKCATLSAS